MKRVFLIRHGKTLANDQRLYCGFTDIPLSDKGKEEIKALKSLYDDVSKDAILIYSGLKRSEETLEILFNKKGIAYKDFREMNFGDFEMKSYEQLKNNPDYIEWIKDTYNNKIKNGESFYEMRERVMKAYGEVINKYKDNDDIVIVCHGGTIYHIIDVLFKENKYVYEIQPGNGHAYIIKYDNDEIAYETR